MARDDRSAWSDDESLDRLLLEPQWREPGEARIKRLQSFWLRLRRGQRRTGAVWMLAMAAGILLAVGAACWSWLSSAGGVARLSDDVRDTANAGQPIQRTPARGDEVRHPSTEIQDAIPPNNAPALVPSAGDWVHYPSHYEHVRLFSARRNSSSPSSVQPDATPDTDGTDPRQASQLAAREKNSQSREDLWKLALKNADLVVATQYLDSIADGDQAAVAAASHTSKETIDVLFLFLESPVIPRRLSAARALGSVGEPEVTRRLAQYVASNVSRQEALVALLVSKEQTAAALVAQSRDDLELAAALNAAESQLQLINNDTWR